MSLGQGWLSLRGQGCLTPLQTLGPGRHSRRFEIEMQARGGRAKERQQGGSSHLSYTLPVSPDPSPGLGSPSPCHSNEIIAVWGQFFDPTAGPNSE